MNAFSPPKKKYVELVVLIIVSSLYYFFNPQLDIIILFVFGFVWNWANSIDLETILLNRRYKFSFIKTIIWFQNLILKPFLKMPRWVHLVVRIFPAGLFWGIVIYVNESDMPYWPTFIGSIFFEVMQLEIKYIRSQKGASP